MNWARERTGLEKRDITGQEKERNNWSGEREKELIKKKRERTDYEKERITSQEKDKRTC